MRLTFGDREIDVELRWRPHDLWVGAYIQPDDEPRCRYCADPVAVGDACMSCASSRERGVELREVGGHWAGEVYVALVPCLPLRVRVLP